MLSFSHTYKWLRLTLPTLFLWLRFPAFISWIAISTGIALGNIVISSISKDTFVSYSSLYNILFPAAILSLLSAIFIKNSFARFILFLCCGSMVFAMYYSFREDLYAKEVNIDDAHIHIYGNVISPSLPYPDNIRYLVKIDSTREKYSFLNSKVIQCAGNSYAIQGSKIELFGQIKIPSRRKNMYEFDEYRYLLSNGIVAKFKVDSLYQCDKNSSFVNSISVSFRKSVSRVINRFGDSDHRAILYAAFLGETEYLSTYIKNAFRNSGTYHILSISGLHAAMLTAMCYFLLGILPIPSTMRHIIALTIIWLYQLFIGFIPCLFRATIMTTIIIIAFILQKKNYAIQAIGIAGTLWLLWSPESLFQAGYQLSFAATFGILILNPIFSSIKIPIKNRFVSFLSAKVFSSFAISLAGTVSTIPILLYHFGTVSIFGLFCNIVVVPLMSIAMWSFFVVLSASGVSQYACTLITSACSSILDLMIKCTELSFAIPFSSINLNSFSIYMTIIFVISVILIAGSSKKLRLRFFYSTLLIFSLTTVVEYYRNKNNSISSVTRFCIDKCTAYAIKDNHSHIKLIIDNQSNTDYFWQRAIAPWLRHQQFATLDTIYYLTKSTNKIPVYKKWNPAFVNPATKLSLQKQGSTFIDSIIIKDNKLIIFNYSSDKVDCFLKINDASKTYPIQNEQLKKIFESESAQKSDTFSEITITTQDGIIHNNNLQW